MIYVQLFIEFFKIGLFVIGGGMAVLPFLYELGGKYNWYSQADVANMLAISESTPGPIGVNMSTYVGFNTAGLPGSVLSTLALVIPGIAIASIVYEFIEKFRASPLVESSFYGIRPAVTALIAAAFFEVLKTCVVTLHAYSLTESIADLLNLKAAAVFVVLAFLVHKLKLHPVLYISCGAVLGILIRF